MTLTKYGTPSVCPKCGGQMTLTGAQGNGDGTFTETHQCDECKYKSTTVHGSETDGTQKTQDAAST